MAEGASVDATRTRAYAGLCPHAQLLLRTLAALDLPSISGTGAVAVLATSAGHAAQVLAELADGGWGTCDGDRFALGDELDLRSGIGAGTDPAETAALFAGRLRVRLAGDARIRSESLGPAERDDVLAALGAAASHGHADLAAALALTAWRAAGRTDGSRWWKTLAQQGEDAAIAARRPELLVELLECSAGAFAAAADWAAAEFALMRVLAFSQERGDRRRFEDTLMNLGELYHRWGRHHRAMDVSIELVAARADQGDPVRYAEALTAAGSTMARARRPDTAISYLNHADRTLAAIENPAPVVRRAHAGVLRELGRVHREQGAVNKARTLLHRALTLVVDVDDADADQIRALHTALSRS